MTEKANCRACRYHSAPGWLAPVSVRFCQHPDAKGFNRVYGSYTPRISQDVTDKCDAAGWFEEKKPWWQF